MKRDWIAVIFLCATAVGCATGRTSEVQTMATLMGSLKTVEAAAYMRVAADPREEVYRDVAGILTRTVGDLKASGWPMRIAPMPCGDVAMHCPDSKCPSRPFGDAICNPVLDFTRGLGRAEGLAGTIRILEAEILLRFAHAPSTAMMEYLDGRLRQTYDQLVAVK